MVNIMSNRGPKTEASDRQRFVESINNLFKGKVQFSALGGEDGIRVKLLSAREGELGAMTSALEKVGLTSQGISAEPGKINLYFKNEDIKKALNNPEFEQQLAKAYQTHLAKTEND